MASVEMNNKTNCNTCNLCNGSKADIVINAHGNTKNRCTFIKFNYFF